MWSVHTVEYYAVIKKNGAVTCYTMWMNLENMLPERDQTQKATYRMIPLYEMSRVRKSRDKISGCLELEEGGLTG